MYPSGTKLEINKDFDGIAEVVGLYPRGQSGYGEDHIQIVINGFRILLPVSVIDTMFKELSPFTVVEEEVVPVAKPKVKEPEVEVIKKLKKKRGI